MKKIFAAATLAGAALVSGCATLTGHSLVSGDAPVGELVIRNNSGVSLGVVTISKCSAMSHGLNRIDGAIPNGGARSWRVDQGCWDVQIGRNMSNGYQYANFSDVQIVGGRQRVLTVN